LHSAVQALRLGREKMGEIVNLRRARKEAKRRDDSERAAANRLSHGRTKAEKTLEEARSENVRRILDAHKIDTGDTR